MNVNLKRSWELGQQIGKGGFGRVFAASDGAGNNAVVKLVPKAPGADRELLFEELSDVPNVVPVIDRGETDDSWVLVMPRADKSLRQHVDAATSPRLTVSETAKVLSDLASALASLDGRVVHRDIKPENVLLWQGNWCLADFGIARYAEATTAPDTRKFAFTPAYAAPERWRSQRASIACDVYSVGIIGFELLAGSRPFAGDAATLREQHLHMLPPTVVGVPAALVAVLEECLFKAPEARPRPANLHARLAGITEPVGSKGIDKLREANLQAISARAEAARRDSEVQSEHDRRGELAQAGLATFGRITDELKGAIAAAAPAARISASRGVRWSVALQSAALTLSEPAKTGLSPWGGWDAPSFNVILHASVTVGIPRDGREYEGRSHSLWYCDAMQKGEYQWLETAFMVSPFIPRRGARNPFALDPGVESAKALWKGMSEFQIAWSWTPLVIGSLDEFVDRWAAWFADATMGKLQHPSHMPER
jgi:hypothetical protein